jgi:hypothetical protein
VENPLLNADLDTVAKEPEPKKESLIAENQVIVMHKLL